MNLPRSGCCCCSCNSGEDCSCNIVLKKYTMHHHSTNSCLNSSQEHEQIYVLPSSKRKRLSSFAALRKTTQRRQSLNLVCIFTLVLVSFVNVGYSSDISFNSNNFLNGESTPVTPDSPSIPTAASSSLNNVVVPGPSSPSVQVGNVPQPSVTQSYFINGYANQIQKTNVSELRALAGNKPFQLQFRTVCPFGNIMNDVSFNVFDLFRPTSFYL